MRVMRGIDMERSTNGRVWQDATRLDTLGRPCNRLALMIRWLEQNKHWIEHFESGAVELHFSGMDVVGKLAKATLDKPVT